MEVFVNFLALIFVFSMFACIFCFRKTSKAKKKGSPAGAYQKTGFICLAILVVSFIAVGILNSPSDAPGSEQPGSSEELPNASSLTTSSTDQKQSSPSKALFSSSEMSQKRVSYSVDWQKVSDDFKAELTDPKYFSYVKDIYSEVNEADRQITLTAAVGDATANDVVIDLADTMIRRFNAIAQMQDGNIASPSKDYYGGLYDEYIVVVGIAPLSQTQNSDKWFIQQAIMPGLHTKQAPKLQKAYQ